MHRCLIFLLIPFSLGCQTVEPEFTSEEHRFRVVTLVQGLDHPWGLAFLPDGRMLVTERPGRLRLVDSTGHLQEQPIAGLPPIAQHGQGGLLDVALHPRFPETRWIYLSYAARGDGGIGTEVARGQWLNDRLENVQVLYTQQPKSSTGRHFGSRLVFDRQGYLYITQGDRGEMERAQKLDDLAGKIVRLHDDGRIPADNPFVHRAGARPEIFSYGNRNVQGAALNPETGELWAHEHGPQGGDEINVIRAGRNYGWPVITYGVNYGTGAPIGEGAHKAGMEQPLHYWVPSIAPSGMAFYTGNRFPKWRGDLFVGALRDEMLVRLSFEGERKVHEERLLKGVLGRIRDVRNGPDGFIYLLTDDFNGVIARLEPVD
ncbi:MAG: PQQ-dependent sugar dehydrogenase [Gammaproteobacteria bacterium]|nr:PQQ-dependent sugar dehydrogenase [Gammaproteobacteria bacterium]MCP5425468.1 PQQ-dependent sugar dehydrogenase [Gammaproteobacteria bacterium]MCP5459929.1 PQQ-dependent sugar dehydrogenase [Gammaproteobacteria bacterium]